MHQLAFQFRCKPSKVRWAAVFFLFRENKWVNELQERRSRGTFFFIILGGGGDKEQANGGVIYVYICHDGKRTNGNDLT